MAKRGFTLLELIIVIIIIGILGSLGFTQYTKVVEKGRTAEAKTILGSIRTAQQAYFFETGNYSSNISNLAIDAPTTCPANGTYYFSYEINNASTSGFTATANRCTTGGKNPPAPDPGYDITLNAAGAWGGTAGYY